MHDIYVFGASTTFLILSDHFGLIMAPSLSLIVTNAFLLIKTELGKTQSFVKYFEFVSPPIIPIIKVNRV